jgi:hypothetical protein
MKLVRARLTDVRRCPARSDYRELQFCMQKRPWSWCFPAPTGEATTTAGALVLFPASFGVMAKIITAVPDDHMCMDGNLHADGVDPAVAVALAISGLPVLIHFSLATSWLGQA